MKVSSIGRNAHHTLLQVKGLKVELFPRATASSRIRPHQEAKGRLYLAIISAVSSAVKVLTVKAN